MEVKRRGFLGLFGGAAVAGPSVVKNSMTPLLESSNVPRLVSAGSYDIEDMLEESSSDWGKKTAKQYLKYLKSGIIPDDHEDEWVGTTLLNAIEIEKLQALQSVSPIYKTEMLKRAATKRAHEETRKTALRMVKKHLGLGALKGLI